MTRGEALEPTPEGVGDTIKTIGHIGVGTGPTHREAEAIIEKTRQRRAEETDHGNAPPRAALAPDAVQPDRERQRQVVGRVIAPGAEEIGEMVSRATLIPCSSSTSWGWMRKNKTAAARRNMKLSDFQRRRSSQLPRRTPRPWARVATRRRGTRNALTFTAWVYHSRAAIQSRVCLHQGKPLLRRPVKNRKFR